MVTLHDGAARQWVLMNLLPQTYTLLQSHWFPICFLICAGGDNPYLRFGASKEPFGFKACHMKPVKAAKGCFWVICLQSWKI